MGRCRARGCNIIRSRGGFNCMCRATGMERTGRSRGRYRIGFGVGV